MNYLWEVVLKADDCGTPREKLYYVPAKICSPYVEVSFVDINQNVIEETQIEANPLYRFTDIFAVIFDCNATVSMKTRYVLFDICMQYMIQLDLRQGLSKSEYRLRSILKNLLGGVYRNNHIKEAVTYFTHTELRKILIAMNFLLKCASSIALFRQIIREIYPDSIVYLNNDSFRELLIYIGQKETVEERAKVELLTSVFLPKDYTIHLFWDHHFGIIDVDATMELDEMVLF